ncbi:hypothetical protein SCA6_008301 [Theobroma cacao]
MNPSKVRCISECFVKPPHVSQESKQPFYLTTWDLAMLSVQYIQKGLLFAKPPPEDCPQDLIKNILDRLKKSLSLSLVHFYPLAGRLATRREENPPAYFVFVDCNNSPGAKFIHAAVDATARRFPNDQLTSCRLAINNRSRLDPPLSPDYFGNSIQTVRAVTTAGELVEQNLGWAAWQLHLAVVNHTDKSVRGFVNDWLRSPFIYQLGQFFDPQSVMMGSSPRFNKYGNEFGLGKALALRSGYAHKFDGKVSSYPGREGGGSIDLEVCLPAHSMNALESDAEFMAAVSSSI